MKKKNKTKNPIGGKTLKGENFFQEFRFGTVRLALVWLGLVLLIISRLCLFFFFVFAFMTRFLGSFINRTLRSIS